MLLETRPDFDETPPDEARAMSETLKTQRLESAALWVEQRRAKLPRLSARRLPAVVVAV